MVETLASPPTQSKYASHHQQGKVGTSSKTGMKDPPVLNWGCRLTQSDLYNVHKTVVCVEFYPN